MDILITLVVAVVGSSGIASIVVACLNHHWQKKDKGDARIDALVEANKIMIVDRVTWLGKGYMSRGEIAVTDKSNLHKMHNAYKDLGGDGDLDTIMAEVDHLKVVA